MGALRGRYVYGDLCDARLRVARITSAGVSGDRALGPRVSQLVSFGEDARGRIYAIQNEQHEYLQRVLDNAQRIKATRWARSATSWPSSWAESITRSRASPI